MTTSGKAALRVDAEHDAGSGEIRAHHLLHADGQCDSHVLEALVHAVGDGPVREQRREDALAGAQQVFVAAHVEVGFLLAGEGGVREVLGGGRGAHGHVRITAAIVLAQTVIGGADLRGDLGGISPSMIQPRMLAPVLPALHVGDVEGGQGVGDFLAQVVVVEVGEVGARTPWRSRPARGCSRWPVPGTSRPATRSCRPPAARR
jgi:hypothetical protein